MRKMLVAASVTALLALPATALEVTTTASEDFQEKLQEEYGERELETLSNRIESRFAKVFEGRTDAPATISVEIVDAKPNRPTFQQLSDQPSLDFGRSLSIGGADLIATAYDADGVELATVQYDWFENDITQVIGLATWSDANRAIRRMSSKLDKAVKAGPGS